MTKKSSFLRNPHINNELSFWFLFLSYCYYFDISSCRSLSVLTKNYVLSTSTDFCISNFPLLLSVSCNFSISMEVTVAWMTSSLLQKLAKFFLCLTSLISCQSFYFLHVYREIQLHLPHGLQRLAEKLLF